MEWCDLFKTWVQDIEKENATDCPAKVFTDNCKECENLKLVGKIKKAYGK